MMLNSEDDAAKDKKAQLWHWQSLSFETGLYVGGQGADKKEKATRNAMQATMNVTLLALCARLTDTRKLRHETKLSRSTSGFL